MESILHRVGIRAPASKVYEALVTLEGIAGWWTKEASGACEPGGRVQLGFSSPDGTRIGAIGFEVVAQDPGREVRWRFESGPDEWVGTEATFRLSSEGGYTIVRFAHRHWREAVEFTEHCSTKWATFLLSLRELVETGRGRPAPDDVRIGDWH